MAALLAAGRVCAQEAGPAIGPPPAAAAPAAASSAGAADGAVVGTRPGKRLHAKGDPLEGFNRTMFSIHQFFDRILFRPAAIVYKTVVPKLLRRGITHLFSNISEPIVLVNDVLQLRPKHGAETIARFIINSTAGVGGIFDVAKTAELPHRDNGFGNTLARYGVGPGPYLFIPFFGPGNFRDSFSTQIDGIVLPIGVGFPFNRAPYTIPSTVFPGLDLRIASDDALKTLLGGAADPYATLRSVYTQNREAEVAQLTGKTTASPLDDPLLDPQAPGTAEGAPPADAAAMPDPLADALPPSVAINPIAAPAPVVTPTPTDAKPQAMGLQPQ